MEYTGADSIKLALAKYGSNSMQGRIVSIVTNSGAGTLTGSFYYQEAIDKGVLWIGGDARNGHAHFALADIERIIVEGGDPILVIAER